MYLIIGNENCSRCEVVKNILANKEIQFNYVRLNDMSDEDQQKYIELARESKRFEMPLIIKDEQILSLQEVI